MTCAEKARIPRLIHGYTEGTMLVVGPSIDPILYRGFLEPNPQGRSEENVWAHSPNLFCLRLGRKVCPKTQWKSAATCESRLS